MQAVGIIGFFRK